MGFLAVFFFRRAGGWPAALTPNLEDQVIFDQGSWRPPGRRKRGRPKRTWADGIRGLMGERD